MAKDHSLPNHISADEKDTDFEMCFVKIPHPSIHSKWFANRLSKFIKRQFGIKLRVLFDTFKVNRYFQIYFKVNRYFLGKSKTLHALSSNVAYQFTCSCDTNLSCIWLVYTTFGTKAGERLNLDDSQRRAIKDHIRSCRQCCNKVCNVTSFKILRKCNADFDTKIHEALLIKKTKATTK